MTLNTDDALRNINLNIASQINNKNLLRKIDVRNTRLEGFDFSRSEICQIKTKHQPEDSHMLENNKGVEQEEHRDGKKSSGDFDNDYTFNEEFLGDSKYLLGNSYQYITIVAITN